MATENKNQASANKNELEEREIFRLTISRRGESHEIKVITDHDKIEEIREVLIDEISGICKEFGLKVVIEDDILSQVNEGE